MNVINGTILVVASSKEILEQVQALSKASTMNGTIVVVEVPTGADLVERGIIISQATNAATSLMQARRNYR